MRDSKISLPEDDNNNSNTTIHSKSRKNELMSEMQQALLKRKTSIIKK